jgi:hypothetical protein
VVLIARAAMQEAFAARATAGAGLQLDSGPTRRGAQDQRVIAGAGWRAACGSSGHLPRSSAPMIRMTRIACVLVLALGACASEDSTTAKPQYNLVDADKNGLPDGIDIDGDGVVDVKIDALCKNPLVDKDADGIPEAIDLDCDGKAEIELCADILVDADQDGDPDGVDFDCDGQVDVDLPDPGNICVPDIIDGNADGIPEGIDLDCDGGIDLDLPDLGGLCVPGVIDSNGDGLPEGLDRDCDGTIDVPF